MVFFTCNACGQAVKKNQVEKHYLTKCRNCTVLSCIDCGKEFVGDEYQAHVKCITEDEKYGGKGFQPKPSSGKGEAKQANWIAKIKKYVSETNIPNNLANLLNNIMNYTNVPRKKQKFQNFIKNSAHIRDNKLADQAWEIFMKANEQEDPPKAEGSKQDGPEENVVKQTEEKTDEVITENAEQGIVKRSKKKRKESDGTGNFQNGNDLVSKGEIDEGSEVQETAEDKSTKEKKIKKLEMKGKAEDNLNHSSQLDNLSNGNSGTKSKKKRKRDVDAVPLTNAEDEGNAETEKHKKLKKHRKEVNEDQTNTGDLEDSLVSPNTEQVSSRKKKNKKRDKSAAADEEQTNVIESTECSTLPIIEEISRKKKKKKKRENVADSLQDEAGSQENEETPKVKRKKHGGATEGIGNLYNTHEQDASENGSSVVNTSEVEVTLKKKKKKKNKHKAN